ncbi:hypothetical protein Bca101_055472 [Brassica carinata]
MEMQRKRRLWNVKIDVLRDISGATDVHVNSVALMARHATTLLSTPEDGGKACRTLQVNIGAWRRSDSSDMDASYSSGTPAPLKALKDIASTLGVKHLNLSEDPCLTKTLVISQVLKEGHNSTIRCDCHFNNNQTCHITHFILKTFSLPGRLPPELSKLQYLESIDLCLNYLYGSIPMEWASLPYLTSIELYASGLREPIPDSIFRLENLIDLRISDTTAGLGQFPHIISKNLKFLVLRNLNLTGPIPTTIWDLPNLMTLDLSFNRLTGEIPADATPPKKFAYVTLYSKSLHINCGGPDVTIENSRGRILYEGNYGLTGSATNYHGKNWGFSNTGDFMDDGITEDTYSISSKSPVSAKYPELYQTARRSPLSLAYFAFCFENGSYNVKLHFSEIQFSDEEPYARLAKRFFNIYVQGKLVWEDFNIRVEANGAHKEVIKEVNTTVTDNTLEIRLYWAGKGTTIIPKRGNYGSLISAISGRLPDGTLIAVKKLSSKSCQGNKEFVNEIGMIACLQHPNLVKLYGCCCENNQLLLVYEYLENNCLADALFGRSGLKLEWGTRHNICLGIARGLAFLHEDSAVKIIHRDIKGTNVLLDKDLNSKISDFGLARLHEDEKSHITTRVAGTIGYMAPEYAMRGHLTEKADVYSFAVVAMEIVSGKSNANYTPDNDCCVGLLDWVLN